MSSEVATVERGIFLTFKQMDELQAAQQPPRAEQFVGYGTNYGGTFFSGVGSQPTDQQLLRGTKSWAAIAATAVARRVRGLNRQVGTNVETETGKEEFAPLPDHILQGVLDKPNPIFDGDALIWLTSLHLQQVGEAFWQKVTDQLGVTRELYPLPPQNVCMVVGKDGQPVFEVQGGDGRTTTLQAWEVVHFWEPDPETLLTSMGRLGPQHTQFLTGAYLDQHLEKHYQHDATPRVVLTARENAERPSQDDRDVFNNRWRNDFNSRRGRRIGEPAFLPTGWDAKELSAHGGISDTDSTSKRLAEQIMAAYGVPKSQVGLVEDVNRATAEATNYIFDTNTVFPQTELMDTAMTNQLAMDYDPALRVRTEPFIAADKDFELRREQQDLALAVRSPQNVIEDRGGDPERASWGEFPVQPFSSQPYTGEEDTLEDPNDLRGSRLSAGQQPRRRDALEARASSTRADVDQTDTDAIRQDGIRFERRYVPPMTRSIMDIFKRQQALIIAAIEANPPPDTGSNDGSGRGARLPMRILKRRIRVDGIYATYEPDGDLLDEAFRALPPGWKQQIEQALGDRPFTSEGEDIYQIVDRAWQDSATTAFTSITGEEVQLWSAFTETAAQAAARQTIKMADDVLSSTRRKITGILEQGIAEGDGVQELTKRITDSGTFGRKRARTIARTELGGSHQTAQLEGWEASGQVEGKGWSTTMINSRDSHIALDGVEIAIGEDFFFSDTGETAPTPRAPSLSPENRVNCACIQYAVIIGGET